MPQAPDTYGDYNPYDADYGPDHGPDYGDVYDGAAHELTVAAPVPVGGPHAQVRLRADFGAHFEANYQRLVAQLFAITLNAGEAHDVVQDAYSRAWRQWATVGRLRDPAGWIRRVAVRSTIRSWRRSLAWLGVGRPKPIADDAVDPRTAALLGALARLPIAERRAVVLHHMVGWSPAEIAVVERSSPGNVGVRLARASEVVVEGLADVLPEVLGYEGEEYFR